MEDDILEQKLKKISQRKNSVSDQVESVNRHTFGVDQHHLWPRKVHDGLEFEDLEMCPRRLFYFHY